MTSPFLQLIAGRFELHSQAGSGGMGTVYRARDRQRGGLVAVKLMNEEGLLPRDAERFLREAQFLAELRHPGIVGYIAHGVSDSTVSGEPALPYLAMEWLEGESLAERLRGGPLSVSESLQLLRRVAEALGIAHSRGIVHGDLKPSNLFLRGRQIEQVTLLDFGLARRWRSAATGASTEQLLGTIDYVAPEQARGATEMSPAADIFSLGSVIYECLCGQPPFRAGQRMATLAKILLETPRPLGELRSGIPLAVVELIGRMLGKDVAQRPADALALREELLPLLGRAPRESTSGSFRAVVPPSSAVAVDGEQRLLSVVLAALPPGPERADQPTALPEQSLDGPLLGSGAEYHWLLDRTLIATFSGDGSAIDQAGRAGRLALRVVEQWPAAVVVIATGRATSIGQLAVGQAIERATELLLMRCLPGPEPGENSRPAVWLDELSAELLRRSFSIASSSDGSPILCEPLPLDRSRRLLGRPTACVGREVELAALEVRLRSVIAESRALSLVVIAPPGIGKSRLSQEFLRRWLTPGSGEPELEVTSGRSEPMSSAVPYSLVAMLLRRICGLTEQDPPELQRLKLRRLTVHLPAADGESVSQLLGELCGVAVAEPMKATLAQLRQEPARYQLRLRTAFCQLLRAEASWRPQLLVLEDLHYADGPSIDLLRTMLSELGGQRIMLLGLARPEVRELLPQLFGGSSVELLLQPLDRRASERLLRSALGQLAEPRLLTRLATQAGGNPLFLEEMVRTVASGKGEAIPETVTAMLQARMTQLAPEARRILRLASVWGESFRAANVQLLVGAEMDLATVRSWLAVLRRSEFLDSLAEGEDGEVADAQLRFGHGLLRDAAYGLLSSEERVQAHSIAAFRTERQGGAPLHYQRALVGLDEQLDTSAVRRRRAELLVELARSTRACEPAEQNLARLDQAAALLEGVRSPETVDIDHILSTQIEYWRAIFYYDNNQMLRAIARFQDIIDRNQADEEMLLLPASLLGRVYTMQGQFGRALWLLDKLNRVLSWEPAEIDGQLVICVSFWGISLIAVGEWECGIEIAQRAVEIAQQRGDLSLTAAARGALGAAYILLGDPAKAEPILQAGLGAAEQSGSLLFLYINTCFLAWVAGRGGDSARALASLKRAEEVGQKLGRQLLLSDWLAAIRAELALRRGESELAGRLAAEAVELASSCGGIFAGALARRIWAEALFSRGPAAWPAVEEQLGLSRRAFESGQAHLEAGRTQALWGRLYVRLGQPRNALPHLQAAAASAARFGLDAERAELDDEVTLLRQLDGPPSAPGS